MGISPMGALFGMHDIDIPPQYYGSGVLPDPSLVQGKVTDLLELYGKLIDAAGDRGGKYLKDLFELEFSNFMVPFRAQSKSRRLRRREDLKRRGVTDPVQIERIMQQEDRISGSTEAGATRKISHGQSLRREKFPFQVGALVAPFLTTQQRLRMSEELSKHKSAVDTTEARNKKTVMLNQGMQKAISTIAGGAMGGMGGGAMGGGGGFMSGFGSGGSIGSGGGFDFLQSEFTGSFLEGGGSMPFSMASGRRTQSSDYGNEYLDDFI